MTSSPTFGAVDPLATVPRYTTLALVKDRLQIPTADTGRDPAITQAIVAAEVQIDQSLGRSFPDTGTDPEIDGIPAPIVELATVSSVAVWKAADAPLGSIGSDDWLGSISIGEIVSNELDRNPLARGYRVSWGVG